MREIIYTVDDEEPDCNRCDYCDEDDYYCIKRCGAEHGWNGRFVGGGVMREIIYTVDDEEPDCNRCDYCDEDDYYCIKRCGAEHGWNGYERSEIKEK